LEQGESHDEDETTERIDSGVGIDRVHLHCSRANANQPREADTKQTQAVKSFN
jgi:hypothetical protein